MNQSLENFLTPYDRDIINRLNSKFLNSLKEKKINIEQIENKLVNSYSDFSIGTILQYPAYIEMSKDQSYSTLQKLRIFKYNDNEILNDLIKKIKIGINTLTLEELYLLLNKKIEIDDSIIITNIDFLNFILDTKIEYLYSIYSKIKKNYELKNYNKIDLKKFQNYNKEENEIFEKFKSNLRKLDYQKMSKEINKFAVDFYCLFNDLKNSHITLKFGYYDVILIKFLVIIRINNIKDNNFKFLYKLDPYFEKLENNINFYIKGVEYIENGEKKYVEKYVKKNYL